MYYRTQCSMLDGRAHLIFVCIWIIINFHYLQLFSHRNPCMLFMWLNYVSSFHLVCLVDGWAENVQCLSDYIFSSHTGTKLNWTIDNGHISEIYLYEFRRKIPLALCRRKETSFIRRMTKTRTNISRGRKMDQLINRSRSYANFVIIKVHSDGIFLFISFHPYKKKRVEMALKNK